MDEDKLNTLRDLTKFAPTFLTIKAKSGQPIPFNLNIAQDYIHNRLEAQLKATGKVRAAILKGRQQGCCFSEQMRVLTSSYEWVEIKNVQVGDTLFAIDEEPFSINVNGRKTDRKIQLATVQAKVSFEKEAFEVCLSNGVKLQVTGNHRMLFKQRGGCLSLWRKIEDAIVGDYIRSFSCPPPDCNPTYEDGWFGGILDGEGSFGCYPAARIGISQVNGLVLERCKKYLNDNGIKYYELIDRRKSGITSKYGDKEVHCIRVDRQADIIKILTLTRPSRFINRTEFVGKSLPNSCEGFEAWVKIESIRPIGKINVVDLQTSTKTFICEGLVSHNSTYIQARYFHKVITTKGKKAFILTHEAEATKNLFEMTKRYYEKLPDGLCPEADRSSAKELRFLQFDSGYSVGTAGNKGVGRSQTIQLFHGSEVAYWPNAEEHAKGVMQAVSNEPGTEIILESTANGIGNYFHKIWQAAIAGDSEYQAIFVPWYWQAEYRSFNEGFRCTDEEEDLFNFYNSDGLTLEHLAWRRIKIAELSSDPDAGRELFCSEYPFTADEAFRNPIANVFINAKFVMRARKADVHSDSALIIGVDPAISDTDQTAIIRRRGRLVYQLETFRHHNTMEIAGKLARYIKDEQPKRVYIDCIGIGAGVVDRLIELGFSMVEGINVARTANDKEKFANVRAELWWTMRDWLYQNELPVQIPDSDELHRSLVSLGFKYRSNGQLLIESKDDLRKRGMPSPDEADALSLTFYSGIYATESAGLYRPIPQMDRHMFI